MTSDIENKWQRVWESRELLVDDTTTVLEKLIALDGFDTPLGRMNESDWIEYGRLLASRIGVIQTDSLFELGCGSGAFLYPFMLKGHKVAGLDFSKSLINAAIRAFPEFKGQLLLLEAIDCPVEPKFDIVLANHVFHYFPSMNYAEAVLEQMVRKTKRSVIITALPDITLRAQSELARRGLLAEEQYNKKYEGLEILYFNKLFFSDFASRYQLDCHFQIHNMPGFAQNKFRFDCILEKD